MILTSAGLVPAAKAANMRLPRSIDDYNPEDYIHWHLFRTLQLGRKMPVPDASFENAKIIKNLPVTKLKTITISEIESLYGAY